MGRRRIASALAVSLTALLLVPGLADARIIHFTGHAQADPTTDVTFDIKGFTKMVRVRGRIRRRFVPTQVSNVHVAHQIVHCYKEDGSPADPPLDEFRATNEYPFYSIPPMKVTKPYPRRPRRFDGHYRYPPAPTDPTTLNLFSGYFEGRRVSGHFTAQYSPGGISYGYCGNKEPEFWTGVAPVRFIR